MAFRQRVPTQSQHAGDWRIDNSATAAGQKQAQERGAQVTLCMSGGVASFTFDASVRKQQVSDDDDA